jgi:hypothetical protein
MVHAAVKAALQSPAGAQNRGPSTPQEREEMKELLHASNGVVTKAREAAHTVVVRLLTFRNDVHVRLRLQDFKAVWDVTMDFVAASGEPANELRGAAPTGRGG